MISIRNFSPRLKRRLKDMLLPRAPTAMRRRETMLSDVTELRNSLTSSYFGRVRSTDSGSTANYLESADGRRDLGEHMHGRLVEFRRTVAPWINRIRTLEGLRILEVGCGTGSSTVALSEQGAVVVGLDVDQNSLDVAQVRARLHGVKAHFICGNAQELTTLFDDRSFDCIIFFASLEHMTLTERLSAMNQAWSMLSPNGLFCLTETPNRLWYHDFHTSWLPFFEWLPEELAFQYSRFSPRKPFADMYRTPNPETKLAFLREGRGVSYHEFDLALEPSERLDVVSSLPLYSRSSSPLAIWSLLWTLSTEGSYERTISRLRPDLHRGFFQPLLELIIRKR